MKILTKIKLLYLTIIILTILSIINLYLILSGKLDQNLNKIFSIVITITLILSVLFLINLYTKYQKIKEGIKEVEKILEILVLSYIFSKK